MKYKILAIAVLTVTIYSCATKSSVPVAETPKKVELSGELAEGKSLYENSCARCHQLYSPKDYNAEQWKPIVLRMAPKARLDEAQGQKIYNYLTMN